MSYDLYLFRRENAPPLKAKGFRAAFKGRPLFTVEGTRAGYHNEKTGVYFTIHYSDGKDSEAHPGRECLHFNLNYFRSHVFGLEAEPPLSRLVRDLDLTVSDPQNEGMGDGEYTPDGFLRGWNAGNRFAHQAMLSLEGQGEQLLTQRHVLPAAVRRAAWEWTYRIDRLYDDLHDDDLDVFIPQVMYVRCDGTLRTACVWPQLIPTALPAVDRVLVMRTELPPRFAEGVDTRHALVSWEEVRAAAEEFEVVPADGTGLDYLLLDYGTAEEAPDGLVELVRRSPAFGGTLQGVPADQILDEELVRECAAGGGKGKRKKRGDT
jgi:hypothetical protein